MEVPACPTHPRSRVVRAGLYGRPSRQRWLCRPAAGQAHRFIEVLPRRRVAGERCLECETELEVWEGPQLARLYGYSTREVAHALIRVAQGTSYRQAAAAVARLANRVRPPNRRPAPRGKRNADPNAHPQIVMNWVEVFAEAIWSAYAPAAWPAVLLLDSKGFSASTPVGGARKMAAAFSVLAAVGYVPGRIAPVVWGLDACGNHSQRNWARFLNGQPGTPGVIISDGGQDILGALTRVFPRGTDPAPEVRRCEWHLGKNMRDALPGYVAIDEDHPLTKQLSHAMFSAEGWASFERVVRAAVTQDRRFSGAVRWLDINSSLVQWHITTRRSALPRSVGPVDRVLEEVARRIEDRAGCFGNRTRTNRLLMLMALEMNGQADEREWAELIRAHVVDRSGYAKEQRMIDDPAGVRSIRA